MLVHVWLTLLYCAGLVMMYQVLIQDFIDDHINKYIGSPWGMCKDDDFKLSHEEAYMEIFPE